MEPDAPFQIDLETYTQSHICTRRQILLLCLRSWVWEFCPCHVRRPTSQSASQPLGRETGVKTHGVEGKMGILFQTRTAATQPGLYSLTVARGVSPGKKNKQARVKPVKTPWLRENAAICCLSRSLQFCVSPMWVDDALVLWPLTIDQKQYSWDWHGNSNLQV